MKYNFDQPTNRRNTDSIKWDVKDNELPLWIADMDFETAPAVKQALTTRVSTGIYGYTEPNDDWYNAYINFYKDRYAVEFKKEELMFCLGVVPAISSSVRKITNEGDNVVILSPVYNIFYNSIINNNRKILEVPLLRIGDEYKIDFENLEKAFALENTTMMIFCNPHNPIGKIWTKDELERIGSLAKKYNVVVLSDEIHAYLTRPNKSYIPYLSVNETNKGNSITCISVTKAFNLAGIHTSCIVVPNKDLFKRVNRQINTDEVAEPNIFSCPAAIAALNESRDWLDELREILFRNRDIVDDFIKKNIPCLHSIPGDATYLLWIDCSKLGDSKEYVDYLREKTGLFVTDGSVYGKGGHGYFRMNVATQESTLQDALERLKAGTASYIKEYNL